MKSSYICRYINVVFFISTNTITKNNVLSQNHKNQYLGCILITWLHEVYSRRNYIFIKQINTVFHGCSISYCFTNNLVTKDVFKEWYWNSQITLFVRVTNILPVLMPLCFKTFIIFLKRNFLNHNWYYKHFSSSKLHLIYFI